MSLPSLAEDVRDFQREDESHDLKPSSTHVVQFYESEQFLYEVVTDYLADGLSAGEPLIVIATDEHLLAFCRQLELRGTSVERLRTVGRLKLLDARETLAKLMKGEMPDADLFRAEVGRVVEESVRRNRGGRIRAYGEMVDLLWRGGNPQAAIRLEELWNQLARVRSFSLLCGYSLQASVRSDDLEHYQHVCNAHAKVLPGESYLAHRDEVARHREVTMLQQRARALQNEVARRQELEAALRQALADRQRFEEELRRQNEELSRTVRFSELFVGILGHDLRNPLSAICTAAQVLTRRADSERVALPAKRILNSSQRMGRMIDQLLDFTRIRLGNGLPLERASVDLMQVCRLVVEELDANPDSSRISMDANGDPTGEWDGDRLAQLSSNLLANAMTHGTPGAPVVLRIDGTAAESVVLEVANAGAMEPEAMAGLFRAGRSATEKTRRAGFGLGLFISKEIVLAHGGTIDVSSAEDSGTRVTVRLPRSHPTVACTPFGGANE
jgi:signal transduction histidine kinase